jgi:hypothetical protein
MGIRNSEVGSWNAECGRYENHTRHHFHFRILHSEFHIHLPLSSVPGAQTGAIQFYPAISATSQVPKIKAFY